MSKSVRSPLKESEKAGRERGDGEGGVRDPVALGASLVGPCVGGWVGAASLVGWLGVATGADIAATACPPSLEFQHTMAMLRVSVESKGAVQPKHNPFSETWTAA